MDIYIFMYKVVVLSIDAADALKKRYTEKKGTKNVKIQIKKNEMNKWNVTGYNNNLEPCVICTEAPQSTTLGCNHAFCADCILTWVKQARVEEKLPSCPLCRSDIFHVFGVFGDELTAEWNACGYDADTIGNNSHGHFHYEKKMYWPFTIQTQSTRESSLQGIDTDTF